MNYTFTGLALGLRGRPTHGLPTIIWEFELDIRATSCDTVLVKLLLWDFCCFLVLNHHCDLSLYPLIIISSLVTSFRNLTIHLFFLPFCSSSLLWFSRHSYIKNKNNNLSMQYQENRIISVFTKNMEKLSWALWPASSLTTKMVSFWKRKGWNI